MTQTAKKHKKSRAGSKRSNKKPAGSKSIASENYDVQPGVLYYSEYDEDSLLNDEIEFLEDL